MKILTWHDKHGEWHYDVSTEEKLHAAALQILDERVANGYIYEEEDPEADIREQERLLALTDEEIAALPTALLRYRAEYARRNAEDELQYAVRYLRAYDASWQAVNTRDGRLAVRALELRDDFEYEGISYSEVADPLKVTNDV